MTTLSDSFERWAGMPTGAMADWEHVPLMADAQIAAVAALQGSEIHFAVDPAWRGTLITRRRCRDFLAPLLDRWGFLTTRVLDRPDAQEFITRLGFEHTWADGPVDHYMLTALPFTVRRGAIVIKKLG